jgi:ABC-2 type transport system ATP-binding protein
MANLLSVANLTKTFGRVPALDAATFDVRQGEVLGLLGPNGAGKTTLFECLAGAQAADAGTVTVTRSRPGAPLFFLPDGITPWPSETVEWALSYVAGAFGGRVGETAAIVERLGIAALLKTRLGALSKGQRKRALLALGLLTPQPLLLIDEPFEGLDLRQGREVAAALRWHAAAGRTLFVSIHQVAQAARFCDRFIFLSNGRVCATGTTDELAVLAASRLGRVPEDFEEVFLALT